MENFSCIVKASKQRCVNTNSIGILDSGNKYDFFGNESKWITIKLEMHCNLFAETLLQLVLEIYESL